MFRQHRSRTRESRLLSVYSESVISEYIQQMIRCESPRGKRRPGRPLLRREDRVGNGVQTVDPNADWHFLAMDTGKVTRSMIDCMISMVVYEREEE